MTKNEQMFYIVFSAILIVLFFLSVNNTYATNTGIIYNISVIIDEENDDNWKIFKSGMEKASYENNVDINFVTLYENYNVEQQIQLIKREVDNGANALIISPTDSDIISKRLNSMNLHIPVVFINNEIVNAKINDFVTIDDVETISKFAKFMAKENKDKKAVIITDNMKVQNIFNNNQLIMDNLQSSNIEVEVFYYHNLDILNTYLTKFALEYKDLFIITLSENNLKTVADFFGRYNINEIPNIYGIGFNDAILHHLDSNVIKAIIAPDYYGLGYISIEKSIYAIKETYQNGVVLSSKIIESKNIFEMENQMILFPIQ